MVVGGLGDNGWDGRDCTFNSCMSERIVMREDAVLEEIKRSGKSDSKTENKDDGVHDADKLRKNQGGVLTD